VKPSDLRLVGRGRRCADDESTAPFAAGTARDLPAWQGQGYSYERAFDGPAYERQFYLTNVANGIKLQNVYMTFGGTSWGWLPASVVYTSYDYGAAISEPRQLTNKIPAMKELGYFLQAVPDITKLATASPVSASNSLVTTYHLANPDTGTNFFFVRNDHTPDLTFTVPVSTADGSYTVPQVGTLQLNGKDMKVIVAGYQLDSAHLVYSASHLMTHAPIGGQDVAVLASRPGDDGETVLRYPAAASGPAVSVLGGTGVTSSWDASTGDLLLDYPHQGVTRIQVAPAGGRPLLLLAVDDTAAGTFWRLDTAAGPVLVSGPALVRTATMRGDVLDLTGDTAAATPLEVWAPRPAGVVFWNGRPVPVSRTASGSLASRNPLSGPPAVDLPALAGWKYAPENPEADPGFDDSGWNVGQYVNNVGPQTTFVLPTGLLQLDRENTLAIAVLADGSTPGGLGAVTVANLGTVAGGVPVHPVLAPDR
jgi:Beta-galactosidase, domain 2/Beta-galactosidase, domain 3/Glycosyl hydrolases family 35/Beta-galactosidase jelly roll domain